MATRAPLDYISNKMLAVIHSMEPAEVAFLERAFVLDFPPEKVRETLDSLCANDFVERDKEHVKLLPKGKRYCRKHGLDLPHRS